ncbi:MAG TPA: FGGY-family carbohydrate kinase [Solirubrobacteraceae bacterium]
MSEVTVGIDIGTSSVKAVAADDDGNVIASARVPHEYRVPAPDRLEHDATVAWRDGPRRALEALAVGGIRGVCVSAMVPSLTAVDDDGAPLLPGLLYGDERGRAGTPPGSPATGVEFSGFVRWSTEHAPGARGLWPAQAVANFALAGAAAVDTTTASTAYPVYNFAEWDAELASDLGARVDQFPRVVPTGTEVGRLPDGAALASGCIDAMAEQLVAGADRPGDVHVLLGTTLIVWVVGEGNGDAPGWLVLPNPTTGITRVGGPSNAGGLFCDWVGRLVGPARDGEPDPDPWRVPVWAPYVRGERSPLNNPDLRAVLDRLDLTHGAAAVRRAAFEASGFVVRRAIEAARDAIGTEPARVVASGGGVRVDAWVQAIADASGLPVDRVAVPQGAALGCAWLARMAVGLEQSMDDAARWARTGGTVEPRDEWLEPVGDRYRRFRELSDALTAPAGA